MEKLLAQIRLTVTEYQALSEVLNFDEGLKLQVMLKNMSSDLFFLQKHLDDARMLYYNHLKVNLKDDMSVSGALVMAKADHPIYDQLKQVMRRAGSCFESMRSNQSFLKEDLKHK